MLRHSSDIYDEFLCDLIRKPLFFEHWNFGSFPDRLRSIVPLSWRYTEADGFEKSIVWDRLLSSVNKVYLETILEAGEDSTHYLGILYAMNIMQRAEGLEIVESFFGTVSDICPTLSKKIAVETLERIYNVDPREYGERELPMVLLDNALETILADEDSSLLLVLLAEHGERKHIELLLNHGVSVNAISTTGNFATALLAATRTEEGNSVEFLSERKDIDLENMMLPGDFGTALIAACTTNNTEIVRQLLNKRVEVSASVDNSRLPTPLVAAIKADFVWAVLELVRKGVDIDGRAKKMRANAFRWDAVLRLTWAQSK